MKKFIALLAVCGFAFAFVACGGGNKTENTAEEPATTEETTPVDSAATDTTGVSADTTAQ